MRRRLLAVATMLGLVNGWPAAAQAADWIGAALNGLHYEVLLPEAYDPTRRYPLVLYLHQLDMGDFPEGLLKQASAWFDAASFRSRHPCIVVMPMLDQTSDKAGLHVNFGGWHGGHAGEDKTVTVLKQVMGRYLTDSARVYVAGNSMGGIGTWQMLLDYNVLTGRKGRIFAAGMPLAGANWTTEPAVAAKMLRKVPIWSIHGAGDKMVPLHWDRTMGRLLGGRPTFRYTENRGLGHNVWDAYYTRSDVWDWLFAQRAPEKG